MQDVPPPPRRSRLRRPVAVLGAAFVVAAGTTGAVLWRQDGGSRDAAPVASRTATPTRSSTAPTPSAARTPSAGPTSVRSPKPIKTSRPRPRLAHEYVAAAAPTSFRIAGPKFEIKAQVCGMDNVRPLDPPGEQHHTVCWVQQGFGVAPGSRSATTYVLGHAWGQDSLEVLNSLSESATTEILGEKPAYVSGVATYPVRSLVGYVITLHTPTGVLTYTVRKAYGVAKSQAASLAPLMNERTKRRVVIITCAELHHVDYEYNVIVEAYLSSSVANRT